MIANFARFTLICKHHLHKVKWENQKRQQTKKTLTLKEKVDASKCKDKSGCGSQILAEKFFVRKTQILSILKNRDKILRELETETNEPSSKQRSARKTDHEEINKVVWEWFKDMSRRKLPISGSVLQEKALQFAEDLGNTEFKASNGCLESFRKRNNIAFDVKSGEKADADIAVVKHWKEKLPTLLEGYNPCDIFNMNETGLFFRTTEDKTLHQKGQECSGGKNEKIRLTIPLCTNMVGDKETPLVIWKSLNPRCFKRVNRKTLPVEYHANKKAWMTGIFETLFKKFGEHMGRKGRKVLLFLDNATSHSDVHLCNVNLKFLPANTTSILQPLEHGIILAMKRKYRKTQIRYMIT